MRPPPGPAGPGSCGNGLIAERSIKSFFATLKGELVEAVDYQTRDEARADLFQYIEGFYNRRRLPMGSATSHPSRRQQRSSQRLPPRSSVRESGASPIRKVYPALDASARLIVVATPSVATVQQRRSRPFQRYFWA